MEEYRTCDQCGFIEPASNAPDWVDGKCEICDPRNAQMWFDEMKALLN